MNETINEALKFIPEKYRPAIMLAVLFGPYVTRSLHALANGRGLWGAVSAVFFGTNSPMSVTPSQPPPSGRAPVAIMVGIGVAAAVFLSGCAAVAPGADPLVVHAEQTLTGAQATFDTFLQLDNQNRALVAAKAPPVHAFAEWLRQPQTFGNTTNTAARWACLIESAELTKEAYKANRVGTNAVQLTASLDALAEALTQTQSQLAAIKAVHN